MKMSFTALMTKFWASVLSARCMTRMNDSHAGVHLVVDFVPVFFLELTLLLTFFCTCSSLRLGMLFNFFCTCLPCWECSSLSRCGSALLSSITLFWASDFFAVNNPFSLTDLLASCHQDHPSVRAHPVCWLELCSLSGVAVCECVSLAPRAPYTFRLRSVVPRRAVCQGLARMVWWSPSTTRSELSLHFGMVVNSAVPRLWPLWCVAGNTSSLEPPLRRSISQTANCTSRLALLCLVSRDHPQWSFLLLLALCRKSSVTELDSLGSIRDGLHQIVPFNDKVWFCMHCT